MINSSSERIAAALRQWIATAPAGARLPATRALAAEFGAGPVTVQQALRTLIGEGLVEARPGVGTFVRAPRAPRPRDYGWQAGALGAPEARLAALSPALRSAPDDAIPLHAGYPDRELLPERLVRTALARAAKTEGAVTRMPAAGLPELRSWFAEELAQHASASGPTPSARDVVIVPGSQSALSTLFRTLVGAGEPLLIESPSYWGAILAAAQAGVRLVPVPSGVRGPDPEELDRAFARTGARAFYAQPAFANPTGALWSRDLADEVLAVVRRHGAFLVEDDWARDFAIDGTHAPIAARDDDGRVIAIRSLTKSVSPAIRVAAIIARGPARDRILADTQAQSMYVSGVLQSAALDVVAQPAWRTHLKTLRGKLAARRDVLVDALREHAPDAHLEAVPRGGLNLWLGLSDDVDLAAVVRACDERGVAVAAGDGWFPAEPSGRFLRLNFAGPRPESFPEAARIIGDVLRS
ncbi:PLP-dependent aminotransferase family protein [Leucobacter zeae]|nr:PLP-dependent aminotransferase family protein [Leucobacter zeae]